MASSGRSRSTRLFVTTLLLGLFVLFDLGLLGWFIFRSLSQREVERVLLETREEAENLADRLAQRVGERGDDLFTVMTVEEELQTYIDDVLSQREIVQTVEIHDSEGRLVFRGLTTAGLVEDPTLVSDAIDSRELPPEVNTQTITREDEFETRDLRVPIGEFGVVRIGLSEEALGRRINTLREDLIRQVAFIGAFTLLILVLAYAIIWWLWRRGRVLEEKAREAERMAYVGTFASGLAHEIRNPLNSLNLNMQMLEEEVGRRPLQPSTRRLFSLTRSEIGRLERLVTDFLQYARPRPLELRQVPVADLLRDCAAVVAGEAERRGVELTVQDRAAGARVAVDQEQIAQLLLNLVQNALAATEGIERAGQVQLVARREGAEILMEVLDNGVGIDTEQQEKMFDLFYSTRKGGTGLGLAVVRRIASAHNGELRVQSTPGVGTRIQVALPVAENRP